jgi:hypothetical protein
MGDELVELLALAARRSLVEADGLRGEAAWRGGSGGGFAS